MARKRTHKDVEFHVQDQVSISFEVAVADAVVKSVSTGEEVMVDVVVFSKAGARWWGGDSGVEEYEEDPDASVFERIKIRAESLGRIP